VRSLNPAGELEEPRLGLDPIVIDPHNEWVYYGSVHGTSVYRIRAADLLDASLSPDALGERAERYGEKALCDGISIDAAGNVYVTDLENNAIEVTGPDGSYGILVRDDVAPDLARWHELRPGRLLLRGRQPAQPLGPL
jgi:sugar lactone lactonase YvrE